MFELQMAAQYTLFNPEATKMLQNHTFSNQS